MGGICSRDCGKVSTEGERTDELGVVFEDGVKGAVSAKDPDDRVGEELTEDE